MAVADGRISEGQKADDVIKDLTDNVISNSIIVPAMVGELSHMQELGFPLVVVPAFRG